MPALTEKEIREWQARSIADHELLQQIAIVVAENRDRMRASDAIERAKVEAAILKPMMIGEL